MKTSTLRHGPGAIWIPAEARGWRGLGYRALTLLASMATVAAIAGTAVLLEPAMPTPACAQSSTCASPTTLTCTLAPSAGASRLELRTCTGADAAEAVSARTATLQSAPPKSTSVTTP